MNEIKKMATAGSLDSSDALVQIEPNHKKGIKLSIDSPFIRQYGEDIKKVALKTLKEYAVNDCILIIKDQGAIDEAIAARIATAIHRSQGE